jgi:hypothetical protein
MDLLERYVAGLNIKWSPLGIPGTFVVSNQNLVEIRDSYFQQHASISGIYIIQPFTVSLIYHFRENEWTIENPDLEYPNFDDDVGDENSSPNNGHATGGNPYTTSEFMGIFITRVVDDAREFCAKLEADNKKPRFVIGIVNVVESITGDTNFCVSLDVSYD